MKVQMTDVEILSFKQKRYVVFAGDTFNVGYTDQRGKYETVLSQDFTENKIIKAFYVARGKINGQETIFGGIIFEEDRESY
jgi:hypothetical protein